MQATARGIVRHDLKRLSGLDSASACVACNLWGLRWGHGGSAAVSTAVSKE